MRIAVLADVHGNLPALEAVMNDFQVQGIDQVWHLGDAVGYGAEPFACLQLMADLDTVMIMGNHEQAALDPAKAAGFNQLAAEAINWTRKSLSPDSLAYLRSLPSFSSPFPEVALFHGLPGNTTGYLRTAEIAESVFSWLEQRDHRIRYAFFGHTHRTMVFTQLMGRPIRMFEPECDLILAPGRRYLLNPGSDLRSGGRADQIQAGRLQCSESSVPHYPSGSSAVAGCSPFTGYVRWSSPSPESY